MKIREAIKSVILVLLILSTLAMTVRLWTVDQGLGNSSGLMQSADRLMERVGLSGLLERLRGTGDAEDKVTYSDRLISPARLLMREEGRLFLLDFGGSLPGDSLGGVYALLEDCLGMTATRLTGDSAQQEWRQALLSDGLLLDLGEAVSYPIFAGQQLENNPQLARVSLRHLVLIQGKQGVRCVLKDASTGDVCVFEGALPIEELDMAAAPLREQSVALPATLVADGFEEGSYSSGLFDSVILAPEILVLPDASAPALATENPVYLEESGYNYQLIYELLDIFEYNPKAKSYPDADAINYVENFSTIRIETDGWLRYKANQATGGIPVSSLIGVKKESYSGYEMVMAAVRFMGRFDSRMVGGEDAVLRFSDVRYYEQSRTVTVDFTYMSDGIPIDREEGYGARITFEAGYLRYVDILLRRYSATETMVEAIPFLKALELLATSTDRPHRLESFQLIYEDTGDALPIRPRYEGRVQGGVGG